VLDLCGGSGTTSIAAVGQRRHAVYVDSDVIQVEAVPARFEAFNDYVEKNITPELTCNLQGFGL
jgi:hypothetical protein